MNKIRVRGLMLLLISGTIFGGIIMWIISNTLGDLKAKPITLLILAAPGAFGLAGLIQLVTGVPFSQISDFWDNLKGWQRGVIGLFVVILSLGLLFLTIGLLAVMKII